MSRRKPPPRPRGRPRLYPPGAKRVRLPPPPAEQVVTFENKRGRKAPAKPVQQHVSPLPPPSPELAASGLVISLRGRPMTRHETGGRGRRVANINPKTRRYIQALERAAREAVHNVGGDGVVQATFGGRPILLRIVWSFPHKDEIRWGMPCLLKVDLDNLEKLALDALKRAGALGGDDSLVVRVEKSKEWDHDGWAWFQIRILDSANGNTSAGSDVDQLQAAPGWLRR